MFMANGGIMPSLKNPEGYASIAGISFQGHTELVIQCVNLCSSTPTNNYALLYNLVLRSTPYIIPIQNSNLFKANSNNGKFVFTLPPLYELVNDRPSSYFVDNWPSDDVTFEVRILTFKSSKWTIYANNKEHIKNKNLVTYSKKYTPLVYYLSPRAQYRGSEYSIFCDPRATVGIRSPDAITAYIDNIPQDLSSRGTNPNQINIVNGARNEIFAKATDQLTKLSSEFDMTFSLGEAEYAQSMTVCNPQGSSCYKARTLPRIDSISESQGFITGGQELIIDGYGFDTRLGPGSVKIQLTPTTDVECDIFYRSRIRIKCITNAVDSATSNGTYVGGSGILRKIYQGYGVQPDYHTFLNFLNPSAYPTINKVDEQVYTSIDNPQNFRDTFLTQYSGLFIPRATGKYKFFIACDDKCLVVLQPNNQKPGNLTASRIIVRLDSHTSYRNWRSTVSSAQLSLVQDTPYYIEVLHVEGGGGDHVGVAMQIEMTSSVPEDHPQATKETQQLIIDQPQVFDVISWTISNISDTGNYTLVFSNPTRTGTILSSGLARYDFNVTWDASRVCGQIRVPIYQQALVSDAVCTVTRYDINNATTSDWTRTKSIIVHVRSVRFLANNAIAAIIPQVYSDPLFNTQATITTKPSGHDAALTLSRPLTGYFQIKCFHFNNGNSHANKFSDPIPVTASAGTILLAIVAGCKPLKDEIEVWEGGLFSGIIQNGRDINIRFLRSWDPPQFLISNAQDTAIPAVSGVSFESISFRSLTTVAYDCQTLFYDQIPVENLRTYHTEPQVKLSINGLEAVCAYQNCNYRHVDAPQDCTEVIVDGKNIRINCDSPTGDLTDCTLTIGSDSCLLVGSGQSFSCTLNQDVPTGIFTPTITCGGGDIPYTGDPVEVTGLKVISIDPDRVNRLGGQILTITGEDFPNGLDGHIVTVEYAGTPCIPIEMTPTTIKCESGVVPDDVATGSVVNVDICINGLCDGDLTVTIIAPPNVATAFWPNPVSPVLRTNMFFLFEDNFVEPFNPSSYQIRFTSTKDPSYVRKVNIRELIDSNQWRARFLGAHAGTFTVTIKDVALGYLDTSALPLVDANSYITSITPQEGSVYGGTEITITGGPFSNNGLENNVKVWNHDCLVTSSSNETIVCVTAPRIPATPITEVTELIDVFLKAAEYAICALPDDAPCDFTWTNVESSSVSGLTISQSDSGDNQIEIQGSFPSQSESGSTCCEVTVNGEVQQSISCDGTSIQALIDENAVQNGNQVSNILVICPDGYPSGLQNLNGGGQTTIQFTGLNVNSGSPAGSQITATIKGLNNDVTGFKLLLANNQELCDSYNFVAFETLICKTKAVTVANQLVRFQLNSVDYPCVNSNTNECYYQTQTTFPVVTISAITLSADKYSFDLTVSSPITSDWVAVCRFAGIYSGDTIVSGNKVTCPYPEGVPKTNAPKKPELILQSTTSTIWHWALVASTVTLDNPLIVENLSLQGDVTCGYGGDCLLAISNSEEPGLTSALIAGDVTITVCGKECVFKRDLSNSTYTVCVLPKINNDHTHKDSSMKKQKDKKSCDTSDSGKTGSLSGSIQASKKGEAEKVFAKNDDSDQRDAKKKQDKNKKNFNNDKKRLRILSNKSRSNDRNDKSNERKSREKKEKEEKFLQEFSNNQIGWADGSGNCFIGMRFDKGIIGVLSELHFFIPQVHGNDLRRFHGVHFQGSNDEGKTWHTIHTLKTSDIRRDWNYVDDIDEQRFNFFRLLGTSNAGSCQFGKIKLIGVKQVTKHHYDNTKNCTVHDPTPNTTGYETCQVLIDWGDGTSTPVDPTSPPDNGGGNGGGVIYDPDLTSVCAKIEPCIGSVKGGDEITIYGSNFSPNTIDYTISFDGIPCTVTEADEVAGFVKCITGARPGLWDNPALEFRIGNSGQIICGDTFTYGYRWSEDATWGEDGQPEELESVWIPKGLTLIVDIPNPPLLKEVIVEGALVFDPYLECSDKPHTFDAYWIFANGGKISIGKEDCPIECNLVITLHGDRYTPEVPLYGNEVIGIRYGTLDIHGKKILPPWIDLEVTADVGATQIQLHGQVNWNPTERIVIASTSYNMDEVEIRTITAVDRTNPDKPILTLDSPLLYKHFASIESCLSNPVILRGEVGLLTRNIVIQGDSNSVYDENGGVITVYSDGDDSSIVRIAYVEFREMGQAYKVGRYALHMRVAGKMTSSYIRGNSLHKSYNRFLALNQARNLLAEWNVVYDVKGHAFFTEIGIEENNIIKSNLVINTKISWSLQNTDQTPAAYFIQNPKNTFLENRAAGSEGYGFWFNLPPTPFGVNNNPGICPFQQALQAFDNNAAHTCQRDGLKQISTYNPRAIACGALDFNVASPNYNPTKTAEIRGFRSWKNRGDGATFDRVGDVRLLNFTAADNLESGIEYSLTDLTPDGTAQINGATIVGFSSGNVDSVQSANKYGWGVITPRTENFQVNNVKFCNFANLANNQYAAIKTCSNCATHWTLTDSGARTVTFSGLGFSNVPQYINYTWPFRDILYDTDSSLTGFGAGSWATPQWKHNEQPECYIDQPKYNGLICDPSVQVRRIVFFNYQPSYFDWADLKVLKYDAYLSSLGANSVVSYQTAPSTAVDYINYDANPLNYSVLPFKQYTLPNNAWAIPFVTGHSYKIHWRTGLDFQRISFEMSPRWKNADKNVLFIFNHTEVRERIDVNITNVSPNENIARDNLIAKPADPTQWQTGDNRHWNETAIRQLHVVANGKNLTRRVVTLFGYNCFLYCPNINVGHGNGPNGEPPCPGVRLWSKPNSWDDNIVPIAGSNVYIRRNCVYIYDIPNSPIYNQVVIEGRVIWDIQDSLVMNTKFIFVRGGWLQIGNSTTEFFSGSLAEIRLHGSFSEQYLAYSTWIEAGGKVLAVTGEVRIFGIQRDRKTRLLETASAGATQIKVSTGLDWVAGDEIALASTNTNHRGGEQRKLVSYDPVTGVAVLTQALSNSHFGYSETAIISSYGSSDIRGEVYLLTSNVRISGTDVESWGGHIVVSDYKENNGKVRNGTLLMDNVEVYNCSQYDTFKAALRFESSGTLSSSVTNSVFRNGLGKGLQILNAKNVLLKDNIFFDFIQWGGNVQSSSDITLDGNVFFHIGVRFTAAGKLIPPNGGLLVCAYVQGDICRRLSVINNIVSGSHYAGFGAPGVDCTKDLKNKDSAWFRNNVAHSVNGHGAIFFPDPSKTGHLECFQAQSFLAYKNKGYGAFSYSSSKEIIFDSMNLIDNYWNGGLMGGLTTGHNENDRRTLTYNSVNFYGDSPLSRDCDVQNACAATPEKCENKSAIQLSVFTFRSNVPFPRDLTPADEIFSDALWNGYAQYNYVNFFDYSSETTFCGGRQQLFDYNRNATDLIPIQRFKDVQLTRVNDDVFGIFRDPNPEWARVEKCGNFPCTGPKNIIISFEKVEQKDGTLLPKIANPRSPFYIISNNEGVGQQIGCTWQIKWNGFFCLEKTQVSQIIFESLDEDKMTRTFSPVNITTSGLSSPSQAIVGFNNVLNSFSDKGFTLYGGQQRRTRFPFTVSARDSLIYNMTYTGTVPKNQRFRMDAIGGQGVIISIRYTEQNSYSVSVEGRGVIDYNPWDQPNNQMRAIKVDAACGENRYLAVVNILEFMIKPGCQITIKPRDVIMASVRLEWTVTDFYSNGGTTLFIDRISSVLGVHPSTIKIVSVLSGSVIIQYQVQNPTDNKSVLPQIKAKIDSVMKVGATFLGAPILDYDASFPVPQDDVVIPNEQKPVVNNTKPVIISQNSTITEEETGPAMTQEQVAKLAIIIGVVLGVCIAVSAIVYCICKKKKETISIHVQQKGENTTTRQGINISQEFDTQYHPKQELGKVFDFDEIEKKKKAKAQIDNLEEDGEQQKNTEDEEEWRQDWGQTDTVRTNANKYTDENFLMNSPTAAGRPSEPVQFNNSGNSDERSSDAEPVERSNQDVKKNESEIYIDTE